MSAQAELPNPDVVNLEIDGVAVQARKGDMIIQVADACGKTIPRFCYHPKLPIAANCRMCLVEVERVAKPLPACATPVAEGMKVHTHSPKALAAQRGVMEFLLINHPLDCPICDQGGECELQDLALGFGRGISRFTENKRVVKDKDIGPLIATDLTRCIHCTRCIRFLEVIAGQKELGATGRGEHMQIGTYIERAVGSELSGNVIDVCPVGALTSKPFRYRARPWELVQHAGVAGHDAIGSNLYVHTRKGRVLRVVPRDNEAINEAWISDRDRFSYQGLYAADRLQTPLIKNNGNWLPASWDTALEAVARRVRGTIERHGAEQLGALIHPSATLEELYLLQKLLRGLGCGNIDHRLRQADFGDQETAPVYPWLGQAIADLAVLDAVLLVGSDVRREQPIAGHRLRQASLRGADLMFVNPGAYTFRGRIAAQIGASPYGMVGALAGVAKVLCESAGAAMPEGLDRLLDPGAPSAAQRTIAERLQQGARAAVLLGALALGSPYLSSLRALAGLIAEHSGARIGYLPEGANGAGAWLAGAVPHRAAGGGPAAVSGLHARQMLEAPRKTLLLYGLEPELDCRDPAAALAAVHSAEHVVCFAAHASERMKVYADVLLPVAPSFETSGTFVNAAGSWQSFTGSTAPIADTRPGWKVLRVLGNLLDCAGFEYVSSEEVRDELLNLCVPVQPDNRVRWPGPRRITAPDARLVRIGRVAMYGVDPVVRRAGALQQTEEARPAAVHLNAAEADRLGLVGAQRVSVTQGACCVSLPLVIDEGMPDGCAGIPCALPDSAALGPAFGPIELARQ